MKQLLLLSALFAGSLSQANAQNYVETFDAGTNLGGWGYSSAFNVIESSGGNPGAYMHNSLTDTFAPQVFTSPGSNPFHGDWRAMGIDSFGVDLITHSTQFPFQREVTLILTNGTCSVFYLGTGLVPQPGTGWDSFDFNIDSASTSMPAGWAPLGQCIDPVALWNSVITDVTEVRIFYGHPEFFFIFDQWDVGMDNARISGGPTGTPLCFGDGTGTSCPCTNNVASGEGCANSTGSGAILSASGGTSATADAMTCAVSQVPGNKPALLFSGDIAVNSGAGATFGDGLRCAGGNVQRLGVRVTNAQGDAAWGPGIISQGGWSSGDTRYLQVWYRDNSVQPCSADFNTSNALEVLISN